MENPNIKTKAIHSQSKTAWNIVGISLGGKYKIARVPYFVCEDEIINEINRKEAFEHATFISNCFNKSDSLMELIKSV